MSLLVGQALSAERIDVVSCRARHGRNGTTIESIVLASAKDEPRFREWAELHHVALGEVRIATDEELVEASSRW